MPEAATGGNGASGAGAVDIMGGIFSGVEVAVDQVAHEITVVRDRFSGENPCQRAQMLEEHRRTMDPKLRNWEGKLATLRSQGAQAVNAATTGYGRPSNRHQGGQKFSSYLANTAIPVPDGVIMAAIFGGPIGAAAAQGAWIDWIDNRLPAHGGRPSASNTGTAVLGMPDVRIHNQRLQGEAVAQAYDVWVVRQADVAYPSGKQNWRERADAFDAKLDELRILMATLQDEIDEWQELCVEWTAAAGRRTDLDLQSQIDNAKATQETDRVRALVPLGIAALVVVAILGWKK